MKFYLPKAVIPLFLLLSSLSLHAQLHNGTSDEAASPETIAVFNNLQALAAHHILFGHQHATEYGHGWAGQEDRSDVKSVCGSHPAVIGMDINGLSGWSPGQIRVNSENLRKTAVATYNRGGITSVCWHFNNPVSHTGFYWNDQSAPAVKQLIPGGDAHAEYKAILQVVAAWAHSLVGSDGTLAPIIFRPFHEFDGDWFWWGSSHCSKEEFISLWRFTVSYLRDSLGVHNFLYAFSPDNKFKSKHDYLARYPGDDWVDILGMDNYGDMGRDGLHLRRAARKLQLLSDLAREKHKLAAFTETGLESITDSSWWTGVLLKTLSMHPVQLSYVLVWRNDIQSPTHYYAPFPGHPSVPDFLKFYEDPYTLFEKDLVNIYR